MSGGRALVHLRRAWELLEKLEGRLAAKRVRRMWDGDQVRRDLEDAENDIEMAARIAPAALLDYAGGALTAADLRAHALRLRAEEALSRGARDDARRHLLHALRFADLPPVHFLLGSILLAEADCERAAEHFERSLRLEMVAVSPR